MKRALNELHRYIGESHPGATLTDLEVERLVDLHEREGLSYKRLAAMFEISKSAVAMYCRGERRCQVPVRWKAAACT